MGGLGQGVAKGMESFRHMAKRPDSAFWAGKRVWLTGHTGFKGSWCALWLASLGADVHGFALPPEGDDSLFDLTDVASHCHSVFGDLRDAEAVNAAAQNARPDLVIHMAAQALVRRSIIDPVETWASNVLGTQNVLEAIRTLPALQAALLITTDKVYANAGGGGSFKEHDPLGGKDPYSASKAACEILAQSYRASFLSDLPLATVRGGNVIGGGDFSDDRLGPDCVRAVKGNKAVVLRQPRATRPWQHVLDCLCGYLLYVEALAQNYENLPLVLNIGPEAAHDLPVLDFAHAMLGAMGRPDLLDIQEEKNSIEAPMLALDASKARAILGWSDRLVGQDAIEVSANWYKQWMAGADMKAQTIAEISAYQAG